MKGRLAASLPFILPPSSFFYESAWPAKRAVLAPET